MALAEYTTATGLDSLASAADATAYGAGSQATGDGSTALGGYAYVWNGNTGELERFATVVYGKESTAIGNGANALEYASDAVGSSDYAGGEMAVSGGGEALGASAPVVVRHGFARDHGPALGKRAEAPRDP